MVVWHNCHLEAVTRILCYLKIEKNVHVAIILENIVTLVQTNI